MTLLMNKKHKTGAEIVFGSSKFESYGIKLSSKKQHEKKNKQFVRKNLKSYRSLIPFK